ncbi:MAG: thiamine pyrophosphate-dependent enzyme [Actinomycetota bacterium]|jgi:2-oxoglutarate ferredoxin oxidoreductase subunit beta|nr:thiamine pyrophosphate-dependent enzyme [Actinomycetota bacterium]
MPDVADYITPNEPTWCPGCGNHRIWEAMKRALSQLDMETHDWSHVWGVGCHGNGADFLRAQGFHSLHGRSLPVATGISLANPDIKVIVEAGDGDGYGLGLGHFVHTARRNIDLAYIVHNNQIYGLTTGQASPTSEHLMPSVSTPAGVLEQPVNPVGLALSEGATFVARGFAGDVDHLTDLFVQAISHNGFALVDVFQPCVTWNKVNTFKWFRDRVYKLEETDHDASDIDKAFDLSMSTFHDLVCTPDECKVPIGVFYLEEGVPTYNDGVPAAHEPLWKCAVEPRDVRALIEDLK